MPIRVRPLAAVVLALISIHQSRVTTADTSTEQSASSLDTLVYKTGWIFLGDITLDFRRWASGSDPIVPYKTGPFEILGRRVDRRKPILPKVGERIRATLRQQVIIIDYALLGEERRLTSPSSVTSIERPLGGGDRTGIFVEVGDVLEVHAVRITRPLGPARVVWGRVSPAATAGK